MLQSFFDKLYEEILFFILMVLLGISMFFRIPSIDSIDWRVIAALWNLMAVAVALENEYFLDYVASQISMRFHNERSLAIALIVTSMGLSMFMTNDVALLTLVPITLLIGKLGGFNPFKLVALETVGANVGSSLTPFGNPQNIFLFNYFDMNLISFLGISTQFVLLAALALYLTAQGCSKDRIEFQLEKVNVKSKLKIAAYLGLFVIAILSILHILPWQGVTCVIFAAVLVLNRTLILQVDYFLLATFILFFLLVDNILAVGGLKDMVSGYLQNPVYAMWVSALSSQLISNVPSAIVFSPFVADVRPILLGVSLGGMGTLIASLANLISWKLYIKEYPKQEYFQYFTCINIAVFSAVGFVLSLILGLM